MNYTTQEVKQFVEEEDVKFIRLAFSDVFGKLKNVSIMPTELDRAFSEGIAIDAWSITGFDCFDRSDLFLHPDPDTLAILPWRPEHGRVIRMYCDITWPDGTPFECDSRTFLKGAIEAAEKKGYTFRFGTEQEFYLFRNDLEGEPTDNPYDNAGYMDVGPADRCANIRREICITLEQMGIMPESSHHEEGPGQNEIDFRYSDALTAADNAMTFQTVVKTVAGRNGIIADFTAKPLKGKPGNGFHINISVKPNENDDNLKYVLAGIYDKVVDMTAFLNPTENSYDRFGENKAPGYVSWSGQNRSQLIRIPAAVGEYRRIELRSPDPTANPYLAFALIIYAGIYGIKNKLPLPEESDINFYKADEETLKKFTKLPSNLDSAKKAAAKSSFIREHVPSELLNVYLD